MTATTSPQPSSLAPLPGGLTPGTWAVDPAHSVATFSVRHAGIARVHGSVAILDGSIAVGADLGLSWVTAYLDAASVSTGDAQRDQHLRSSDFFAAQLHPEWSFASSAIAPAEGRYLIGGFLTLRGVTRGVTLTTEFHGCAVDPWGVRRAGFSATTTISRREFGLVWNSALETGGVLVSDTVVIELEVSANAVL